MGARLLWRTLHEGTVRPHGAQPALILGAGSAGTQLVANMLSDPNSPFMPVGLLDDDPAKRHLRIQGVRVLGNRTALKQAKEESDAEVLIIAIPSARSELFRDVSDSARALGLKVKVLPTLHQILNGKVGLRDLRDIDITDLLGRDPVDTDVAASAGYITGKRVLVTGAGGSIGSELCRQLVSFDPAALLMLDRDESALHALQLSIDGHGLLDTEDVILADIRDREALGAVFAKHRPQVVFHAAALKHLPMLEQYPAEAWKTNVLGTANVLEAAREAGVEVFVNISTDKAANPTSVLGYSKRIAERLTAGVAHETPGKFVSVRFGNVLGSRGSVLPAFADQIAQGGPGDGHPPGRDPLLHDDPRGLRAGDPGRRGGPGRGGDGARDGPAGADPRRGPADDRDERADRHRDRVHRAAGRGEAARGAVRAGRGAAGDQPRDDRRRAGAAAGDRGGPGVGDVLGRGAGGGRGLARNSAHSDPLAGGGVTVAGPNILISSAGRRVGLVRAFQAAVAPLGGRVVATDHRPDLSAACQVADIHEPVARISDSAFVNETLHLALSHGIGLVIPTLDTELAAYASVRDVWAEQGVHVSIPDPEFVAACRDKRRTALLFGGLGISPLREVESEFPRFVKPISGSLSADVHVVRDQAALHPRLEDRARFVHQELIDRTVYDEFTVDMLYSRSGDLVCAVPRRRLEVRGGEISKGRLEKGALLEAIRDSMAHIPGARGCLAVQLFHSPTQSERPVIGIEINARFRRRVSHEPRGRGDVRRLARRRGHPWADPEVPRRLAGRHDVPPVRRAGRSP